jgi:hypothetical protein
MCQVARTRRRIKNEGDTHENLYQAQSHGIGSAARNYSIYRSFLYVNFPVVHIAPEAGSVNYCEPAFKFPAFRGNSQIDPCRRTSFLVAVVYLLIQRGIGR